MVGRDVFLELDCVMVIKMLKEKGTNRSLVAPIILDMDREKSCPKKISFKKEDAGNHAVACRGGRSSAGSLDAPPGGANYGKCASPASSSSVRSRKRKSSRAVVVARPPEEVKTASRVVRRRRGNSKSSAAAVRGRHISSLCDDLLLQIFLRLPSVATLIRAACTCPAWRRAMSSSPDFRRRFRSLHPSPLLGLFTSDTSDASSIVAAFVPALPHGSRPDDDDLAAAVRGGDFSLPNAAGGGGGWRLVTNSCQFGNLLLYNRQDKSHAVINPYSTRRSEGQRHLLVSRNMTGRYFAAAVLSSSSRSRLMLLDNALSKMKATIFAMETGKVCSATPWVDIPACPDQVDGRVPCGRICVQSNGSVYYLCENWGYIASIDTSTMGITVVELPPQCVSRGSLAKVGETKDGETCLVYSDGRDVGVLNLMHTRGDDVQKWVLDRVVSMDAELRRVLPAGQFDARVCVLTVMAVRDGYVYLSISVTLPDSYWLLSLCLATMKLEKLFQGAYGGRTGISYIMPWPRSLIGW
ncbi:hypothetical protein HU200_028548 [Digitaria exilis]|uniref:F-box domain-containing protein n=1 Tax=Digitaria exilis TaxID=1010633 RepID=A0A835BVP1_9POAL|nr:hypothetical protein HU200_028548 [Digitaria exilis]